MEQLAQQLKDKRNEMKKVEKKQKSDEYVHYWIYQLVNHGSSLTIFWIGMPILSRNGEEIEEMRNN